MKHFHHLQGLDQSRPRPRKSANVLVPLLIAAGLIGTPIAIGVLASSNDDDAPPADDGQPATVDTATAYPMNHYITGVGYYHAPYHTWFPFPFGYHDASRGWYRGGQWRPGPTPTPTEQAEEARASGFASRSGTGSGGSSARVMTSRPSADAVVRANAASSAAHSSSAAHGTSPVSRGGFGFSSHPSVS